MTDPFDGMTIDEAARRLAALKAQRKELDVLMGDLESWLAERLPRGGMAVEGVGWLEAKPATKRTQWDHDEVVRHVTARARDERQVDPETGEYEPVEEAIVRVLRECAGIGYWKVTGLRARGLDPDEFCTVERGPRRVTIVD